jgi:glycosyltransferase involved in cell wall biosynthesis
VSPPGVNVLGHLREAKGIGEAARLYATALRAAGVPVRTGALDAGFSPSAGEDHRSIGELERSRAHPVDLVCLNPPELHRFLDDGGRLPGDGRRIGVWAWEVDLVPPEWAVIASELDEVWVYSRYVAEVMGRALPVPVVVVPLPVEAPTVEAAPAGGEFTFLFMFDFHSTMARKNPLGLIEAYRTAFSGDEGTRLVVKTFNGDHRPDDLRALTEAAAGRPDVQLVDRYVSSEEKARMLAECGCYVSLHRSEGFGLTLAEAMTLGRPVVATGFSGNLDFMPPGAGYLTRWEPARVGAGGELYPAGATWAEPDLGHAAQLMRSAFDDPEEAARRGERGRAYVHDRLSPAAVGAVARARLELTASEHRGRFSKLLSR